jgi:hypothetical protein
MSPSQFPEKVTPGMIPPVLAGKLSVTARVRALPSTMFVPSKTLPVMLYPWPGFTMAPPESIRNWFSAMVTALACWNSGGRLPSMP